MACCRYLVRVLALLLLPRLTLCELPVDRGFEALHEVSVRQDNMAKKYVQEAQHLNDASTVVDSDYEHVPASGVNHDEGTATVPANGTQGFETVASAKAKGVATPSYSDLRGQYEQAVDQLNRAEGEHMLVHELADFKRSDFAQKQAALRSDPALVNNPAKMDELIDDLDWEEIGFNKRHELLVQEKQAKINEATDRVVDLKQTLEQGGYLSDEALAATWKELQSQPSAGKSLWSNWWSTGSVTQALKTKFGAADDVQGECKQAAQDVQFKQRSYRNDLQLRDSFEQEILNRIDADEDVPDSDIAKLEEYGKAVDESAVALKMARDALAKTLLKALANEHTAVADALTKFVETHTKAGATAGKARMSPERAQVGKAISDASKKGFIDKLAPAGSTDASTRRTLIQALQQLQ